MQIQVTDLTNGNIIFIGESEDFLYINENDSDLEFFLSNLQQSTNDESVFLGYQATPYLVEKVFEEI